MNTKPARPIVSIIMSAYNSELYLIEAIDSILGQSFDNFEFIIFDDHSTDTSGNILNSYNDARIKVIHNETNIGLTRSLNKGLALARGKYIARMDADDISLPGRLERQVNFLDKNPLVGLCGTWIKYIDSSKIYNLPVKNDEIKATLFKTNCVAHPTFMFRKDFLDKYQIQYNENYRNAQDYELVSRCIDLFEIVNIPEVLLYYRLHPKQISVFDNERQSTDADLVRLNNLKKLIINPTNTEENIHLKIMKGEFNYFKHDISLFIKWIRTLKHLNQEKNQYPKKHFNKLLLDLENEFYLFLVKEVPFRIQFVRKVILRCITYFHIPAKWFYYHEKY